MSTNNNRSGHSGHSLQSGHSEQRQQGGYNRHNDAKRRRARYLRFIRNESGHSGFRRFVLPALLLLLAFQVMDSPVAAEVTVKRLTSRKGLGTVFITDPSMDFIHAEVIITYTAPVKNPAVPHLVALNLFSRQLNENGGLPEQLQKLGNDYTIIHEADYILIKMDFLPNKLPQFARFLKLLYRYKPFLDYDQQSHKKRLKNARTRFRESVRDYWTYFYNNPDWDRNIATQVAYQWLFADYYPAMGLVTEGFLKTVTLKDLETFYRQNFRFPNSQVVIKGDLNPSLAHGTLERELATFRIQSPLVPVKKKLTINPQRNVFLFNTPHVKTPTVFWFEVIPPVNDETYLSFMTINQLLFRTPPFGKIYPVLRNAGIEVGRPLTFVSNHRDLSVICNSMEINGKDIEDYIKLVDREKKDLTMAGVSRNRLLRTHTFLVGKIQVDSRDHAAGINREILRFLLNSPTLFFTGPSEHAISLTTQVLNKQGQNGSDSGVIVIVGDRSKIEPYLKTIKPTLLSK